jgi:predicted AlkP superfamily pyrophosphatase or phosphodiesterase
MDHMSWLVRLRRAAQLPVAFIAAFSLFLSASSANASPGISWQQGDPRFSALDTPAKYLVLMIVDGGRPDYFSAPNLPHIHALAAHGTRFKDAISGILESETPAAHTTISTGSTPRRNGIIGFSWAQDNERYTLFNPDIVRAGAMEHIMQNARVPTIVGLYKARYPKARAVAIAGAKYYAADPLGGPQADAIMYFRTDSTQHYAPTSIPGHVPPYGVLEAPDVSVPASDHQLGIGNILATRLALSSFAILHQRLTLINYGDFDWPLGHVDGGNLDKPAVTSMMQTLDQDLGQIEDAYQKAGILKQTLFVVTADHGMSPIRRFVPESLFTNAIARAGAVSLDETYSTGAYIWLKNDAKAAAVAANILRARDPGIASVYYWAGASKQPRYVRAPGLAVSAPVDAANRYLLSTMLNGHQPTVVAFCTKNATTTKPTTHWKADHGGSNWNAQHIPLIMSGPGIQTGAVVSGPAQLIDIAPTILADMGVRPENMDGHVLTDALTLPAAADQPARQSEIQYLTPIVQALVAENKAESRKPRSR